MAEWGNIRRADAAPLYKRQLVLNKRQLAFAFGLAALLHFTFALWLQMRSYDVRPLPSLSYIDVALLPRPPDVSPAQMSEANTEKPAEALPELEFKDRPTPQFAQPKAALPAAPIAPPIISNTPPPILNNEAGSIAGQFPSAETGKDYVPSKWALEPPLKTERLKGMGLVQDMDCLRALSEDCAALRKEVFAEFELTEMEKIWTAQRADTGMPAEFYGMSEREIRLKIGSHIAGENGFMLLPGIAIDGSLWDMMHGVKKTCEMKRGINSDGRYEVVRVCPESLPSARDKKYNIPPKR